MFLIKSFIFKIILKKVTKKVTSKKNEVKYLSFDEKEQIFHLGKYLI